MRPLVFLSLLALVGFPGSFCSAAEEIPYGQLKGDALKEVLKPIPPKEPADALRCLEVIKGFSVEFVAHEPLVLDPVAAAIDENGLLYVAEDADYPYRPEGAERPLGRVRVLKDNDGDGFYEESHLFAEGLLWAAGVAPWKGGVFVTAPPDIWYLKDTNGDYKADIQEKVYTGFGTGGSQYILNNLQWGLDHRIYAAVAGNGGLVRRADRSNDAPVSVSRKDFRFDPATREFESISGGKQFGNTFDDWGNRFLCTQDTPIYQVIFQQRYLERNPFLSVRESTRRLAPGGAPIFRTSRVEAWRAVRSSRRLLAQKGSPNDSGVSHHVLDGVAGTTVYRGGAFPSGFYGNIFSGDAQNNLVHRRSLIPEGVLFRSERLDQGTEFLRSTDNWFRPVNFVNAPDGTLYVVDLAREVLEAVHIPMDVVSHLDLTRGRERGRIFRVKPDGFRRPAPPKLGAFTTGQLVGCLESPHAWWRETAHRLLYERQDKSAAPALRRLLKQSPQPQTRLHALWSLDGLKTLSDGDILMGLKDSFPGVRENAVQLAESRLNQSKEILSRCLELAADPNSRVRFQLAFSLGEIPMGSADRADQHANLSLTPALSPGERESSVAPRGQAKRARLTETRATIPPLPKEEGQSEGRVIVRRPANSSPNELRAVKALSLIAKKDAGDSFIRTALLSSSFNCAASLIVELLEDSRFARSPLSAELCEELARIVGARNKREEILSVLAAAFEKERADVAPTVVMGLSDGLRFSGGQVGAWIKSLPSSVAQRFDHLMAEAIRTIETKEAGPEQIKNALRLLENSSGEKARASILELLDRFPPAAVQAAAIRTLSRLNPSGLDEVLLARWRAAGPEARREIFSALLAKRERVGALLAALENGRISAGEVDAASRARLRGDADSAVRQRAVRLWGEENLGARNDVIKQYREALDLKGDSKGGQDVFGRLCSSCHRLNGIGNEVGPNLALASSRSSDELLTHILDPNRAVDPAYVQFTVESVDGETFSGLMVADNAASVTIKGINFQRTIPRTQIKKVSSDGLSLMPVGLEQSLSLQEMANLLAFLIDSQYDFGTSGHSYSRDMPERK